MPSLNQPPAGRAYWRSLEEFSNTPEFREALYHEFPKGAIDQLDSTERRDFLKFMGASLALAGIGLAGCRRWPEQHVLPYAYRPEGRIEGVPVRYATTMEIAGVAHGLLVTSYDGRPVKIEGNPDHPMSLGGTSTFDQAAVLDLYDPDRSRNVIKGGSGGGAQADSSWAEFAAWAKPILENHKSLNGNGLAVLAEASSSPARADMKTRFMQQFPSATWHEYEANANDAELAGSVMAFGSPHRAHHAFDRATVVVSLDSDFLLSHPAALRYTREFARGRRSEDAKQSISRNFGPWAGADASDDAMAMSRLYSFEATLSLTGANADVRTPVRSADIAAVAAMLLANISRDAAAQQFVLSNAGTSALTNEVKAAIDAATGDLLAAKGRSIVIAGERQPAAVHALAAAINQALENQGKTVSYSPVQNSVSQVDSIKALTAAIDAGSVKTLVILGGNPVYNAPADVEFGKRLATVTNTVHLSLYNDETSQVCQWHINRAHDLEAWGDTRAFDGSYGITQPLIEPLFGGKSSIELLAFLAGDTVEAGYDIVRRSFAQMTGAANADSAWRKTLHDGVLVNNASQPTAVRVRDDAASAAVAALAAAPASADGYEIIFTFDNKVFDGRFANNGWLQELPDPLSKLTWDNAVLMSPATGKALGLKDGSVVKLVKGDRVVRAAAMMLPGHHEKSVTVALGYGRTFPGRICAGSGFDFYPLRRSDAMGFVTGAQIEKTGEDYVLASTMAHFPIDSVAGQGTQTRLPTLVREANLSEYRHDTKFVQHRTHVVHRLSLWDEPEYTNDNQWAMAIDLAACTGCAACVVACQAENNIPIVGKDQILRGRELHWLRIDRYFRGQNEAYPDGVLLQPVMCMHCETAPCEQVCPVAATVHDNDGLNVMVYNRCIGTRYCSNNCPYKVRRFNYFDYHRREPEREEGWLVVKPDYFMKPQAATHPLKQMQFNPEVTVRVRGVMEKCTYCVQRIAAGKIKAKNDWVKQPEDFKRDPKNRRVAVPDGSVVPACGQACPAEAIVFGDLNDPASRVSQLHKADRTYQMLEELNTKPRTRYLAKIRNPHPSLEKPVAPASHGHGHSGADDHGGTH